MQDPLQVLIVEGDPAECLKTRNALQTQNSRIQVQEASRGFEAAQALGSRVFDCALLGAYLTDGRGIDWLVDVRKLEHTLPIIMLVDLGEEELAADAVKAGATDYLSKADLTPQLLRQCLRGAVRCREMQEQMGRAQEQMSQAQAELHLSNRAIAAASSGVVICDPHQDDCPIIYANPAFFAMTGYLPEEVIGRNCRFLQGTETDDRYIQQIRDCLHQGIDCRVVLKNYKRDGTLFWNELTISPVRSDREKITHFIGVQTDITERRNAEDALRQNVAYQQAVLRDMFASVTEGKLILCASENDLPTPLTPFTTTISLSATGGVRELRRQTAGACRAVGIPDLRRDDLETAVGEAGMNAVVHAVTGTAQVFTHKSGKVQVRVEDKGGGIAVAILPSATLQRGYSTAGTMGHGFKMILKTADRVYLLTGGKGTTVVIEMDRTAPMPIW